MRARQDFRDAEPMLKNLLNRHVLLGLVLLAACILIYVVGIFYQRFLNNPADLVALVFIVAIYMGAIYNQVKDYDKK
jgi:biotin transporter BioY